MTVSFRSRRSTILRTSSGSITASGGLTKQPRSIWRMKSALRRQPEILELIAQRLLVELANAGLRHGFDEDDVVRQPPLREILTQVIVDLLFRHRHALFDDDAGERALLPFRVMYGDDRGFGNAGDGHDRVLEIYR